MLRSRLSLYLVSCVAALAATASGRALSESSQEDGPLPTAPPDLASMHREGGRYVQHNPDGATIVFTLDPRLQERANALFDQWRVPAGAAVMIHSRTGRILALSQRRHEAFAAPTDQVALDPTPPAASVFKIVTAAALLEEGDAQLDTTVCYHGGAQGIAKEHLIPDKSRDTACATLQRAFGFSINAVFARLSDRYLTAEDLMRQARRFGFGRSIPSDIPVPVSPIDIPEDRVEKARASAGFWHSHLSPFHAAVIAQAVAQQGAMLRPYLVDHVEDAEGAVIYESAPRFVERAVSPQTAAYLRRAMQETVRRGTARHGFYDNRHRPFVPGVEAGGKTGTLFGHNPFRHYSWFVGLAPVDRPEVAIAVLVINGPKWRVKAPWIAAQLLRTYFATKK